MATLYGAQLWKSPTNAENYDGNKVLGKNSEAFTSGDPVSVGTSGLYVATTVSSIYGIAAKTQTMSSTNDTVALVHPAVQPIDQDYEYLMGTNGTLVATSVGVYYQLAAAGGTGTIQVDVNSGAASTSNRVVVCTAYDPRNSSETNVGLFKFVKVSNIKSDE